MFRILVIDDQPSIHKAFRAILAPEPKVPLTLLAAEAALFGETSAANTMKTFRLTHTLSGAEGVARVQESLEADQPFALAFVDMRMGTMDGRETVRLIWQIDPQIQIVFCTAYSDHGWSELASLGPADRWLILKKDFDPIEVTQVAHAMGMKWRREQENAAMVAQAVAANRAKSEFLCNLSHELRTPNHAIGSFIGFALEGLGLTPCEHAEIAEETLQVAFEELKKEAVNAAGEGVLPEFLQGRLGKIPRWLQKAYRNNAELVRLLNDILDLAKLEAGQMDFSFQSENLCFLFGKVAESCEGLCAARKILLAIQPDDPENFPILAQVDPGKIMQVFRNLLGNAIKFSPDGSIIQVSFTGNDSSVIFSIADQGPGIRDEEKEKIFDKFFQSTSTASGAGGTGLGLPICREYIARHQGRIWAENTSSVGSTFWVELPRKRDASLTNQAKVLK